MISDAKQKLDYNPTPGKLAAQLMMGAWVSFFDRGGTLRAGGRADYEAHLWDPAVSSVFNRGGISPTRSDIHGLTQSTNWARNRINHCEPVVFRFPQLGQSGTSGVQDRHSPARFSADIRKLTQHYPECCPRVHDSVNLAFRPDDGHPLWDQLLFALLAGPGTRIGEALGLRHEYSGDHGDVAGCSGRRPRPGPGPARGGCTSGLGVARRECGNRRMTWCAPGCPES